MISYTIYLHSLLACHLHSGNFNLLFVPKTNVVTYGDIFLCDCAHFTFDDLCNLMLSLCYFCDVS